MGIEVGLTGPALLGRDQHNAIGTTGPINGRGIRILQHLDTFDIVRIDSIERTDVP